mmetsp:Transcript_25116/g.86002  ORF Transcript_25116/g.86002 Transcript_25116/m.86002 type:complete len:200 (-) Transcript_25116:183-782(-)
MSSGRSGPSSSPPPSSRRSCTACSCASASTALRSAPESSSVPRARPSRSTEPQSGMAPASALRIAVRSKASGSPQYSSLSSLPGLRSAASMRSGLEVAPSTDTPVSPSTPSSSVSSWFTTRSVTPVESWPLRGAMASNSSKRSTHGAAARARAKTSRTPASDAPMYLFSSSGPLTPTRRSPAAAAAARATWVLPQPGGP